MSIISLCSHLFWLSKHVHEILVLISLTSCFYSCGKVLPLFLFLFCLTGWVYSSGKLSRSPLFFFLFCFTDQVLQSGKFPFFSFVLQAEFTAMRDQYMRRGEGFIICYSITDRRSFQEAAEFKKDIERVRNTEDIPIVLVGNKYDLEHLRVVCTFSSLFFFFFFNSTQFKVFLFFLN